jgi:putative membrane protein
MLDPASAGHDHSPVRSPVRWLVGPPPEEVGDEPDPRFSYANERTFLAWNRTALALISVGLAVTNLLPPFHVPFGRRIIGLPLIALGAFIALASLREWGANQRAMRQGEPLPVARLPLLVSAVIGVVAVIALVVAALGSKS